ncbi:LysR family transcriptional regulator [Caulobacter sp. KR2-114]|uniref:LysR family transcriptional regulator n=1 Tax=Caulobacter sp. KR2-114 TaxID=3400912 RepID=UPI003C0398BA
MFDWDDLRVFIAAARSGTTAAAARRLGLDATTVGRRIAALESALKATLFVRTRSGLQLTAAGTRLLDGAGVAEAAMNAALESAQADATAGAVAGAVRLSAPEGFGGQVLAPALPDLARRHPRLALELIANPGLMSPLKREVDMAITLSAPESPRLLVEPLTDYALGLFAAPAYLAARPAPASVEALGDHWLVGYVEDQIYAPELRYLEEIDPGLRPRLSSTSLRAQRQMLAAGGGVGVLPCFMAEGLVRVLPQTVRLTRRFWISTHRDVAATARIRAVRNWLKALVAAERAVLTPQSA